MTPSPSRTLIVLLLTAVAVSGWFYGWHWKQVAIGSKPTHEEDLIISLQDQLERLREENDRLSEALGDSQNRIADEPAGTEEDAPE